MRERAATARKEEPIEEEEREVTGFAQIAWLLVNHTTPKRRTRP